MLRSQRFTLPYAAPSTDVFIGDSPKVPGKNTGAQEASGIRFAFSLDTFFCGLCSCIHHIPMAWRSIKKVSRPRVRELD